MNMFSNSSASESVSGEKISRPFFDKFFGWYLSAVLFLTPLFFLPFTVSPVGLNKQVFFLSAVMLGLALLFVKIIREEKLVFRFSLVQAGLFLLAAGALVSLILSAAPIEGLRIEAQPLAFLPLLGCALFAFLLGVSTREKVDYKLVFWSFAASAALVSFFEIYRFVAPSLGLENYYFPWEFTRSVFFAPLGQPNVLAIFAGAAFLGIVSYLQFVETSLKEKIAGVILVLPLLGVVLLINFGQIWLVLAALAFFLLFSRVLFGVSLGGKPELKSFVPLIILLVVCLFLIISGGNIFSAGKIFGVSFPPEYFPDFGLTAKITKSVWNESVPRLFFGSGGGNFKYLYDLNYSREVNATVFWNSRFEQGYSAVATLAAEAGVFGLLAALVIFGSLVFYGAKIFRAGGELKGERIVFLSVLLFLAAFLFLYRANFSLLVAFFAFLGVFGSMAARGRPEKTLNFSFASSLKTSIFVLLILIVVPSAILYFFYWETYRYLGALSYAKGIALYGEKGDAGAAESADLLLSAAASDYWNDGYLRDLARMKLNQLNLVLAGLSPAGGLDKQTESFLGGLANDAIQISRRASELNSADAKNFESVGQTYEGLVSVLNNALPFALEAYKKAAELAPNNPAYILDQARVSLVAADSSASQLSRLQQSAEAKPEEIAAARSGRDDNRKIAADLIKKSLELKSNYSEANLLLAQLRDREGDSSAAAAAAEAAVLANPEGVGELYELGYLYYKNSRISDAEAVFRKLANLYPAYSNGRYYLGLVYDKKGDKKSAIAEFEIVSALNPENAEVKKILENLRAGRSAFEAAAPENPLNVK